MLNQKWWQMKSRYKDLKEAYDNYFVKKDSIVNMQEMVYVLQDISETLAMLYDKIAVNEDERRDGKDSWTNIDTYRLNTYKFP